MFGAQHFLEKNWGDDDWSSFLKRVTLGYVLNVI